MPQIAVPISTVSNNWSVVGAASAHLALDETIALADDTASRIEDSVVGSLCRCNLGTVGDPGVLTAHVMRIRLAGLFGFTALVRMELRLRGSSVVIATMNAFAGIAFATNSYTLTEAEAALIGPTNYDNLEFRIYLDDNVGGITPQVTTVELEVPDPATKITRVMAEVLAPLPVTTRVTRVMAEVLAPAFPEPTVEPLPLPADVAEHVVHNWTEAAELVTAFQTAIVSAADTTSEERRSGSRRPVRTVSGQLTGLSKEISTRLLLSSLRRGMAVMPVPLYSDHARVGADTTAQSLRINTTTRRFFRGQRVLVSDIHRGVLFDQEIGVIDDIEADELILTTALSKAFPEGARVYPLIDAEVLFEATGDAVTSDHVNLRFTALEVPGRSALPAIGDPRKLGAFQVYQGLPIIDLPPLWSQSEPRVDILREGQRYRSGRGQITYLRGDRPKLVAQVDVVCAQRAVFWKILEFFEARVGRTLPFWSVAPVALFEPTNIALTAIDIQPFGSVQDIRDLVPYLGFILKDGTIYIREVSAVIDNTTYYSLTWTEALPSLPTLTDFKRVTIASKVRFTSDQLRENWIDDEKVVVSLGTIDLLSEGSVVIS